MTNDSGMETLSAAPRSRNRAMRIVAGALVAFALVPISQSPAEAGKGSRSRRVETKEYATPAPAVMPLHPGGVAICNHGGAVDSSRGCVEFPVTSAKERFVAIDIKDATGLPVPAFLAWGDEPDEWIPFCGKTPKSLIILGSVVTVYTFAYRAPNLPSCAGTATTGSVTVTFSPTKFFNP